MEEADKRRDETSAEAVLRNRSERCHGVQNGAGGSQASASRVLVDIACGLR